MERLTYRDANGELWYSDNGTERDRLHRLAAYEDTGFTPEEVQQMRWIPVEERLPGVSGNYICAVKDKNGSVWTIPAEWSLEMKTWFGAFGEIKNKVTHWMPLPQPPKEENKDD